MEKTCSQDAPLKGPTAVLIVYLTRASATSANFHLFFFISVAGMTLSEGLFLSRIEACPTAVPALDHDRAAASIT